MKLNLRFGVRQAHQSQPGQYRKKAFQALNDVRNAQKLVRSSRIEGFDLYVQVRARHRSQWQVFRLTGEPEKMIKILENHRELQKGSPPTTQET